MTYSTGQSKRKNTGFDSLRPSLEVSMENGFDTVSFIMDYEDGNLSFDEVVRGFQHLVDTGMILHLQGSYQGVAKRLLEAGYIKTSGPRQYETE